MVKNFKSGEQQQVLLQEVAKGLWKCLEWRTSNLGLGNVLTSYTLQLLKVVLIDQGKKVEAENLYNRCSAIAVEELLYSGPAQ